MIRRIKEGDIIELGYGASARLDALYAKVTQINPDGSVFVTRKPNDGGECYLNKNEFSRFGQ